MAFRHIRWLPHTIILRDVSLLLRKKGEYYTDKNKLFLRLPEQKIAGYAFIIKFSSDTRNLASITG
ncbi:hypothetical protein, partial [Klebsiella michiganensis]|uniref:hypothetical protein n=1 Tax=Klebsiella michiganensis TaxID=1134687 RepID=UPI00295F4F3B